VWELTHEKRAGRRVSRGCGDGPWLQRRVLSETSRSETGPLERVLRRKGPQLIATASASATDRGSVVVPHVVREDLPSRWGTVAVCEIAAGFQALWVVATVREVAVRVRA